MASFRALIYLIALFVALSAESCKRRVPEPIKLESDVQPTASMDMILKGPSFEALVKEKFISSFTKEQGGPATAIVLELQRKDGSISGISELDATQEQIEMVKPLVAGRIYRFPDILRHKSK